MPFEKKGSVTFRLKAEAHVSEPYQRCSRRNDDTPEWKCPCIAVMVNLLDFCLGYVTAYLLMGLFVLGDVRGGLEHVSPTLLRSFG